MRIATDHFEQTTAVAIYQAGELLYEYFDKVCVIYEGRMAYYGPASEARQYFINMGSDILRYGSMIRVLIFMQI